MKKYIISFFSILLLLIVNTSYFWENLPGLFDITILFLTLLGFIILFIVFINQLIKGITEKFKNRIRILNLLIISTVLFLIYLFPRGFINFEKIFYGNDVFFAQYEGVANGTINLKLKKDNYFIEKSVFWGVNYEFGKYKIKNDTLFLEFKNKSNFNQKKSLCTKENEKLINYYINGIKQRPLPMKIHKGTFSELNKSK
jgi:hypothetical protein